MHCILNLMSLTGVNFTRTASVLGYCLLPLVLTSAIGIVISLKYFIFTKRSNSSGLIGYLLAAGILCDNFNLTVVAISWCTYSASAIFVAVLQLTEMRALVAYPVGLFCKKVRRSS